MGSSESPIKRDSVLLPIKTTPDDVDTMVQYLKTKATGATPAEAKQVVAAKLLDSRKLTAYRKWGIIKTNSEKLILAERGWRLAREPEKAAEEYRAVVDKLKPYRSAIEWAHHNGFGEVTVHDVAANWHEHHQDSVGGLNEDTLREAVTCFFALAQAAGLGERRIGRRGSATRLVLDVAALKQFVEAGPMDPPWTDDDDEESPVGDVADPEAGVSDENNLEVDEATVLPPEVPKARPEHQDERELRVFISHGANMDIVDQVETLLGITDIAHEVAVKEESAAIPVPKKVMDAMRRCTAGIICVSVDEGRKDDQGGYVVNENVLIEIGAAFVLYDERVVLLWDRRLPVPSNLQGLYRCEFEGDELDWPSGLKLTKAVKDFRA